MSKFILGQNSLDVCKVILNNHPEISIVRLIAHEVDINWRQRHKTNSEKIASILAGFEHKQPINKQEYSRQDFSKLTLNDLDNLGENQVWSMCSKIQTFDRQTKHLAMMNFHPELGSEQGIKQAIKYICGDKKGVLLDSGRFLHYYGNFLLTEDDWVKFMAEFLMPVVLVSPRYIGHRLYEGFSTLRLTADGKYKPKIPSVIEII